MPASDALDRRDAAHLLRRAAFGGTAKDLDRLEGLSRAQAVEGLYPLQPRSGQGPAGKKVTTVARHKLVSWWLKRMLSSKDAAVEKLVLFWHDHFPSNRTTVRNLPWLSMQNGMFRAHSMGPYRNLLHQVTRDRAMLDFLDGFRNKALAPNENYGREVMELFCLGPKDVNGVPNYTQNDVRTMARSLTGFGWENTAKAKNIVVRWWEFDQAPRVLFSGKPFGSTGILGVENQYGVSFPPQYNILDILFEHRDSDGRPTLARFLTRKLWAWYAYPDPPLSLIDELADVFVASGYVIGDLLRAILTHDEFYSDQARSSTAKTPVEFVLQTLQALGAKADLKRLPARLEKMGMELFSPPGVNGWDHGDAWLTTSRFLARLEFAQSLADGTDKFKLKPEKLIDPAVATSAQVVDALLERLGVEVPPLTHQALVDYLEGGAELSDADWLTKKFRGLFILILTLPEFQVH